MLQDSNNLVSPLTGGIASLHWEWREIEFRKETFKVMVPFYVCEDTKEQFTTTESDNVWVMQMHNQYCAKYGIPYTDEIVSIRARYGLSASKMSLILGFGENQWRRYEQGEIPSLSNGKMIRSIANARSFLDLVESTKELLTEKEYSRIKAKVIEIVDADNVIPIEIFETNHVYNCPRSQDNGFAPLSLKRLKNIMSYLIQQCGDTFCTKMNKLLFYTDFLSYRERGIAMSGLSYKAINYGPVPENWDRAYSQFDEIKQETRIIGNYEGNVLTACGDVDKSLFSAEELEIMDVVCSKFKNLSCHDISKISHKEKACIDCHESHSRIPFSDAFALKAL